MRTAEECRRKAEELEERAAEAELRPSDFSALARHWRSLASEAEFQAAFMFLVN